MDQGGESCCRPEVPNLSTLWTFMEFWLRETGTITKWLLQEDLKMLGNKLIQLWWAGSKNESYFHQNDPHISLFTGKLSQKLIVPAIPDGPERGTDALTGLSNGMEHLWSLRQSDDSLRGTPNGWDKRQSPTGSYKTIRGQPVWMGCLFPLHEKFGRFIVWLQMDDSSDAKVDVFSTMDN